MTCLLLLIGLMGCFNCLMMMCPRQPTSKEEEEEGEKEKKNTQQSKGLQTETTPTNTSLERRVLFIISSSPLSPSFSFFTIFIIAG